MHCATIVTLPISIPQIQRFIDRTTNRTSGALEGYHLSMNLILTAFSLGYVYQLPDEISKA